MKNKDEAVVELIRKMIVEARKNINNKKIITEGKTAEEVFNEHNKKLKEYIIYNVVKAINESSS